MTTFRFSRSMQLLCALSVLTVATSATQAQAPSNPAPPSTTQNAPPPQVLATAQTKPQLEPKALDILKAACARLAAAHSMEFTSLETYESPSRLGFPLAYGTKSDFV
jgi:hypothetical protein